MTANQSTTTQSSNDDDDDMSEIDLTNPRWKIVSRGIQNKKFSLELIRLAYELSQVELANRAGITQGEISRIENSRDNKISSIERYVKALGGTLSITVEIGGRRYDLKID